MRKYVVLTAAFALVWVVFQTGIKQRAKIRELSEEVKRKALNIDILENTANYYQVEGDQKAAEVLGLRLKIDEYKALRSKELAEINKLKIKGRELESVISMAESAKVFIEVPIIDSVFVYRDIKKDTILKCLNFKDPWVYISGCIDDKKLNGEVIFTDSLLIVESYKRKKFLGFLWKTKKIINRKIDVTRASPYTEFSNIEFKKIER